MGNKRTAVAYRISGRHDSIRSKAEKAAEYLMEANKKKGTGVNEDKNEVSCWAMRSGEKEIKVGGTMCAKVKKIRTSGYGWTTV